MVTDKRIIKTRNAIHRAFMTLMLDKDVSKITVSDVADAAQINRSTFYLHYGDVNAVMTEIENQIADAVSSCFEKFDAVNIYESTYALFTELTGILEETDILKKFILYSTASKQIAERLKEIFVETSMEKFAKNHSQRDGERYFYYFTFMASGIIDTYMKWSYAERKAVTLEELCQGIGEISEIIVKKLEEVKTV